MKLLFGQFSNIRKHNYWFSEQTHMHFGVYKLFCYCNLGGVLPESEVPYFDTTSENLSQHCGSVLSSTATWNLLVK